MTEKALFVLEKEEDINNIFIEIVVFIRAFMQRKAKAWKRLQLHNFNYKSNSIIIKELFVQLEVDVESGDFCFW